MSIGGNKKMYEFFNEYDLNLEPDNVKFFSKAADFYRRRVSSGNNF